MRRENTMTDLPKKGKSTSCFPCINNRHKLRKVKLVRDWAECLCNLRLLMESLGFAVNIQ